MVNYCSHQNEVWVLKSLTGKKETKEGKKHMTFDIFNFKPSLVRIIMFFFKWAFKFDGTWTRRMKKKVVIHILNIYVWERERGKKRGIDNTE